MSNKRPFTEQDKVRIQRQQAIQNDGKTPTSAFAARVQHLVDTKPRKPNTQK